MWLSSYPPGPLPRRNSPSFQPFILRKTARIVSRLLLLPKISSIFREPFFNLPDLEPREKLFIIYIKKERSFERSFLMECGNNLSSRPVAGQVLSARLSLTSVFGMRTGGSSTLSSPQWLYQLPFDSEYTYLSILKIDNCIESVNFSIHKAFEFLLRFQFISLSFSFLENKPSTY